MRTTENAAFGHNIAVREDKAVLSELILHFRQLDRLQSSQLQTAARGQ
jgi:hypothetical protein